MSALVYFFTKKTIRACQNGPMGQLHNAAKVKSCLNLKVVRTEKVFSEFHFNVYFRR
jgi:hypothetical protein